MKRTTKAPATGRLLDFRVMVLAVAAILALAVNASDARQGVRRQVADGQHGPSTANVQRSRGTDGAVDAVRTGRRGGTSSVDRDRDGGETTDARVTGPQGGGTTVDRTRGADGAIDSLTTGPNGGTTYIDRSRNADGTVNRFVTTTPAAGR